MLPVVYGENMFDDLFGSFFHGSTGSTKNTYTNDGFSFHNNYKLL